MIFWAFVSSGRRPLQSHKNPIMLIPDIPIALFAPEIVNPANLQSFMNCRKIWACSLINRRTPSEISASPYRSFGPLRPISSRKSLAGWDICGQWTFPITRWKLVTEFVHPCGNRVNRTCTRVDSVDGITLSRSSLKSWSRWRSKKFSRDIESGSNLSLDDGSSEWIVFLWMMISVPNISSAQNRNACAWNPLYI